MRRKKAGEIQKWIESLMEWDLKVRYRGNFTLWKNIPVYIKYKALSTNGAKAQAEMIKRSDKYILEIEASSNKNDRFII